MNMNKKLLKIIKENLNLPIIPLTYHEVCSEGWGYWMGKISKIKIDYFYLSSERFFIGKEDIIEGMIETNKDSIKDSIENYFEKMINEGKIRKSIIIYID